MAGSETVYGIHHFDAENDDEISFSVGEPLIVIQRDDGYDDGWWHGRNALGQIGLFPVNYTSPIPLINTPINTPINTHADTTIHTTSLPTPSTSNQLQKPANPRVDSSPTITRPNHMSHPSIDRTDEASSIPQSARMSQPFSTRPDQPISHQNYSYPTKLPSPVVRPESISPPHSHSSTTTTPNTTPPVTTHQPSLRNTQKTFSDSMAHPAIANTNPEDWSVDQVGIWLEAMQFGQVVHIFKAQEISGDILLELTIESLKELDINTFGKRFKIHSAINALREERSRQEGGGAITPIRNLTESPPPQRQSSSKHSRTTSMSERYHTQSRDFGHKNVPSQDTDSGRTSIGYSRPEMMESGVSQSDFEPRRLATSSSFQPPSKNTNSITSITTTDHPVNDTIIHAHQSTRDFPQIRSRSDSMRSSFFPTGKPQSILPVDSRSSMDSINQRTRYSDGSVAPDMEGWLHKQSDKYRTWNKRWFVLKGYNLFYFKSPTDVRMKGIINLRGYKIILDENIHAGKYSFKAQHDTERTFYFHTDTENSMRAWLKTLIKATISRDYKAPVMSSSTIPTVSLDTARRMKPRPPSVLLYAKENPPPIPMQTIPHSPTDSSIPPMTPRAVPSTPRSARPRSQSCSDLSFNTHDSDSTIRHRVPSPDVNPLRPSYDSRKAYQDSGFSYTARSMAISATQPSLMFYQPSTNSTTSSSPPISTGSSNTLNTIVTASDLNPPKLPSQPQPKYLPGSNRYNGDDSNTATSATEEEEESGGDGNDNDDGDLAEYRPGGLRRLTEESQTNVSLMMPKDHEDWNSADYIDWVNQIIYHKLNDLTEFRTGDMLIELLESLSGKEVERLPTGGGGSSSSNGSTVSASMHMLDKIVAAFKFMSREGVDIEGRFTIKDIFGGNEQKIVDMLSAIKTWVDSYQIVSAKKASGGTFGAKNDRDDLRAWDDDINF
ncbi:hypothetical protein PHYBLDRAFT_179049 [Phycomyces blakesleeanus NRRL 1555(-)]|uniref:Polar growth protein n=1 Tax=Phycomyces blakesleeanus (strain ATCC 8743b / DSM 1359 / FGSC 10004 / NBRC 33097 / NRRL 1555) TaxID=763407 RepID=A0A167Q8E7_PHYB8|nr:hypothetical protein PHYBLDRAFT_179049 [Phycomyces blakesleeanus NRRL 1555(-)]OAD79264.1 hypothetical protein PHYBLDRAFT_179049 [Phycomyces blakesleeanus NRRL 1555(-)]|eukprot:XP_018297304.1 hypothetical protein PHYBLDRAFT_179049 [Phycomyces blakesleeanus NRRL 1555(-)]